MNKNNNADKADSIIINQKEIHIALAFDHNFIIPFYVLLASIFRNNKGAKVFLYTIAADVNITERNLILEYVQNQGGEIIFYEISKERISSFVLPEAKHISSATYYRFYFPELVPASLKRILYLDTDLLVLKSLNDFFNIDLQGHTVAAITDTKMFERADLGISAGNYFNAGVLLMDLQKWRSLQVSERAIELLNTCPEKMKWADQDALNVVLKDNWLKVENRYNFTFYDIPRYIRKRHLSKLINDVVIIHYTTQNKPWLITCTNRYRYLYAEYLAISPVSDKGRYLDMQGDQRLKKLYSFYRLKLKELLVDCHLLS